MAFLRKCLEEVRSKQREPDVFGKFQEPHQSAPVWDLHGAEADFPKERAEPLPDWMRAN